MPSRADEIDRRRKFLAQGDATGWASNSDERAALQSLYDLLVHNAEMRTAHDFGLGDGDALPVTHDAEMLALAKRLAVIELANRNALKIHDPAKIKVVCAWCGKEMGEKESQVVSAVSHGICPECAKEAAKREH